MAGDLGGRVESEYNLSQDGNSWISDNAVVLDYAVVCGNAEVGGNSILNGDAYLYTDPEQNWATEK